MAAAPGVAWRSPLILFLVFAGAAALAHSALTLGTTADTEFVNTPGFELWQMMLATQLLCWFIALPIGARIVRGALKSGALTPRSVAAAGVLVFPLLMAPLLSLLVSGQMKLPYSHSSLRIGALWTAGCLVDAALLLALAAPGMAARHTMNQLRTGALDLTDGIERLAVHRAELNAALTWSGLLLSLAVLSTAVLYHLTEQIGGPEIGSTFTRENVLGFGVYNTALVALAYGPAASSMQALSLALRDRICPREQVAANAPDCARWLKEREEVGKTLQTDLDIAKTLGRLAPVLAPVFSAILGLAGLAR